MYEKIKNVLKTKNVFEGNGFRITKEGKKFVLSDEVIPVVLFEVKDKDENLKALLERNDLC